MCQNVFQQILSALRETAVFREPHLNGLPHDAVPCPADGGTQVAPHLPVHVPDLGDADGGQQAPRYVVRRVQVPDTIHVGVYLLFRVLDQRRRARPPKTEIYRKVEFKKRTPV